jgi:hypothetical protein
MVCPGLPVHGKHASRHPSRHPCRHPSLAPPQDPCAPIIYLPEGTEAATSVGSSLWTSLGASPLTSLRTSLQASRADPGKPGMLQTSLQTSLGASQADSGQTRANPGCSGHPSEHPGQTRSTQAPGADPPGQALAQAPTRANPGTDPGKPGQTRARRQRYRGATKRQLKRHNVNVSLRKSKRWPVFKAKRLHHAQVPSPNYKPTISQL